MLYLKNETDGLYYPVSLVDTGVEMTITWDASEGVPVPPPYSPIEGEPLISVDDYLTVFNLIELDVPIAQWMYIALSVSDAVEAYCATSWRVPTSDPLELVSDEDYGTETLKTPPTSLRVVVAQIIRATLGSIGVSSGGGAVVSLGMKSETLRNYSYTVTDDFSTYSVLNRFETSLRPFRQLYVGA